MSRALDGVQILTREWSILRAKRGWPRTCPDMCGGRYRGLLTAIQQRQHRYGADADRGVIDGVHIGATWRIPLDCLCAAAMQPYVKLL